MTREGRALVRAGILIGAGMGGSVDGIVFHQLLQWHNMVSGWLPPTNLVDAKVNMFWDGVFHAAVWLMTALGIVSLWHARMALSVYRPGRLLAGACVFGWGVFNSVEGLVDHLVLGIHHVDEYAANPMGTDLAFQASGIALLAIGVLLMNRGTPED